MTLVRLTLQDTPARPVTVNTDHVATFKPLRKLLPSMNTQTPGHVTTQFAGTEIRMVDGTRHNVCEDYDEVSERLAPVLTDLASGKVTKQQIPQRIDPVSGAPEPAPTWIRVDEQAQVAQDVNEALAADFAVHEQPEEGQDAPIGGDELETKPEVAEETLSSEQSTPEPTKAPAKKAPKKATPTSADKKANDDDAS